MANMREKHAWEEAPSAQNISSQAPNYYDGSYRFQEPTPGLGPEQVTVLRKDVYTQEPTYENRRLRFENNDNGIALRHRYNGMRNALAMAQHSNPKANKDIELVVYKEPERAKRGFAFARYDPETGWGFQKPVFRDGRAPKNRTGDGQMTPRGLRLFNRLRAGARENAERSGAMSSKQVATQERWRMEREHAKGSRGMLGEQSLDRRAKESGELFGRQVSAMEAQGRRYGLQYDPMAAHNGKAFVEQYNRNRRMAALAEERERINNLTMVSRMIFGRNGPKTDAERAAMAAAFAGDGGSAVKAYPAGSSAQQVYFDLLRGVGGGAGGGGTGHLFGM